MDERTKGYIKLHRRILEWKYYKTDLYTKVVWFHILLTASYKDEQKGTIKTTLSEIASETGTTYRQVRSALDRLKETGEIETERSNNGILITVLKWNEYQQPKNEPKPTKQKQNSGSKQEPKILDEDREWMES